MSAPDPPTADADATWRTSWQHDLKTPLTVISGRAHLLERAIRRSPTLSEAERQAMLLGLAALLEAVHRQAQVIETLAPPASEAPPAPEPTA